MACICALSSSSSGEPAAADGGAAAGAAAATVKAAAGCGCSGGKASAGRIESRRSASMRMLEYCSTICRKVTFTPKRRCTACVAWVRKRESNPSSMNEVSKDSGPVAIPLSSSKRLATTGWSLSRRSRAIPFASRVILASPSICTSVSCGSSDCLPEVVACGCVRRWVDPVLLALKRISGQRDAPPALLTPERASIPAERRQPTAGPEPPAWFPRRRASAVRSGIDATIGIGAIAALLARKDGQRLPRPYFKQHSFGQIEQEPRRIRKTHWLAAMLPPIART